MSQITRNIRSALVCYQFAPMGGGVSQRSHGFAKYLPRSGVEIEIFTASESTYSLYRDESLRSELDADLRIHRSSDYYSLGLVKLLRRLRLDWMLRFPIRLFSFPDIHRWWASQTFRKLKRRHEEHPFDVVYTTSYPVSSHLVGLRAKRELGIPWIADFRDPWTLHLTLKFSPFTMKRARRFEQQIYDLCDHVIVNTEGNRADLLDSFPVKAEKITVLANGFDRAYLKANGEKRNGKFHLLYLGGLRGAWFEGALYELMDNVSRGIGDLKERVHFDFVGGVAADDPESLRLARAGVCTFHGFEPIRQVGDWLARSQAYLLVLPEVLGRRIGWVPQKTYAYLLGGKPILLLGPRGSASELLAETGRGKQVAASHVPQALQTISEWVEQFERGEAPLAGAFADSSRVHRFAVDGLTSELAQLFQAVSSRAGGQ